MTEARTVSILLHAHLPFGMRPELAISLEECWLYEAVANCYLPLLELIGSLPKTRAPMLAVSLSPTLLELWAHPQFTDRFAKHLERYADILSAEEANQSLPPERRKLAQQFRLESQRLANRFLNQGESLPNQWRALAAADKVELLTTAATHAFLPAYQQSPLGRSLQIRLGMETFERRIGRRPKGFWLPECAYYPGLEEDLAHEGVAWFAVENMGGPVVTQCPNGVQAIARNSALSRKVWDAQTGYPGHASYREFHRDAVFELTHAQAGLYRLPDGSSLPLGLKYWRISGSSHKEWYCPPTARAQAEADADEFLTALKQDDSETIFLPFDAELFGHWWHEGPQWLRQLLNQGNIMPAIDFAAPSAALERLNDIPEAQPIASTWGRRSDYSFWINNETDWIYPLLQSAEKSLEAVWCGSSQSPLRDRAIRQLMRELLLAQASDWPFMLRAEATAQYAEERLRRHLGRFHFLLRQIQSNEIDHKTLAALEQLDPIFPDLNTQPDLYFQA
ncbi:1,4-alpha-glucan branching protein domain-containing protein [Cerasicoccus frondis]|uniref:1,4-alpha-glucan branching protein domain-containing protein n=1 Tax=Cerasicoccus frondis TaxID=490090 RepID=UPI002852677A|nr:1,4-alpha-glucan branching protein domain-containing protein [Cerasicoccus frondis]